MLVTVFSDASWRQGPPPAAGWGVWARIEDDFLCASGPIEPAVVPSSTHAEGEAAVRGVLAAVNAWRARGLSTVVLRSDCMAVVEAFTDLRTTARRHRHARGRLAAQLLEGLSGLPLRVGWVKGHEGGKHPRSWVNERADQLSREGLAGRASVWIASQHGRARKIQPDTEATS